MAETTLSAAVRELVVALNDRNADAARKWTTDAAWDRGALPLEPLCRDEHLVLQAAPMLLETPGRAAARVMGFRDDKSRESLWFLFELQDDAWRCVEATRTRLDAEQFLTRKRAAQDPSAGAAPPFIPLPERPVVAAAERPAAAPAGPDATLERAARRLAEVLEAADADALRALSEEGRFSGPGDTPERLLRAVRQAPPRVFIVEWRVRGDRAACRIALRMARGADDVWIAWRLRRGLGWKVVATPHTWAPAGLFVTGRTDDVPTFATLPADMGATKWAEDLLAAASTGGEAPAGVPTDAFRELTKPPASPEQTLGVGNVASLPAIDRALVTFDVTEPGAQFPIDSRYALLERTDPSAPWAFRKVVGMDSLTALLDGIDVAWAEETPAEAGSAGSRPSATDESDEAARQAVLDGIRRVLESNGLDPGEIGLDRFSKEQLEKLVPQLFGGAVAGLFSTLLVRMQESLDEAAARDPEVTVDLARERAKRAGKPVPKLDEAEDEVSREVRAALREALRSASSEGEVKVDTKFLNEQGPKLLGSLFGAVAKALVPAEATLEVPGGPDDKGPVKVKLDLGQMFGALFAQAAQPAEPENRENDAGEE